MLIDIKSDDFLMEIVRAELLESLRYMDEDIERLMEKQSLDKLKTYEEEDLLSNLANRECIIGTLRYYTAYQDWASIGIG